MILTGYGPCSVKVTYSRMWYLHNLLGSVQSNHLITYTYGTGHDLDRIWFILGKIAYVKDLFAKLLIDYKFNYLEKR